MTELAVVAMDAEQARVLTAEIQGRVTGLLPLIREAFERRADLALGYTSWAEYCAEELDGIRIPVGDRPAMAAELRQSGMSTRAIGAALGVSKDTAARDLASVSSETDGPERVTSLDGRNRPATQPPRPTPTAAEPSSVASRPDLEDESVAMPARQDVADNIMATVDERAQQAAEIGRAHQDLRDNLNAIPAERIAEIEESVRPAVQFGQLVSVCRDFVERVSAVDMAYAARGIDRTRTSPIHKAVELLNLLRQTLGETA